MKLVASFLFFASLALSTLATNCPNNGVLSSDGTHCYQFINQNQDWWTAEGICKAFGVHLPSVTNLFVNTDLAKIASTGITNSTTIWIGAANNNAQSKWTWTDGTKWSFTDWAAGQPGSATPRCVYLDVKSGLWSSSDCNAKRPYICATPNNAAKCPPTCPSGWAYYEETKSCYKVYHNANWADARSYCESVGASLTSLLSLSELQFVNDFARTGVDMTNLQEMTWIGLYSPFKDADWFWVDGREFDFQWWAPSQPDSPGRENCAQLITDNNG
uniref:C-type lectin domain-containing protein n=1 Tax=Panagrellus redivivus TaxID=6233 RepID=A0A7E4VNJ0_PANRE